MTNSLKKHGFLAHTERLFTRGDQDAYALIHFEEPEQAGDENLRAIECPNSWSAEAAAVLADAAATSIPVRLRAIEENTVPSWLWRRAGEGASQTDEYSARQIFDRVAGSAAYAGWKQGLFASEGEARAFFDETRFMLMQRMIALEPHSLAPLGHVWAYGQEKTAEESGSAQEIGSIEISNAMIDAIVRGSADKIARAKWQKMWPSRGQSSSVSLSLADVAADWGASSGRRTRAMIDLMAFRHNDGSLNIHALHHAVRLLVILLDLHGDQLGPQLDIGFCNLAPLLMALALPYDSKGGRAFAAGIAALVTAEAYAASAELAGLRGPSADFATNREGVLRALRNHRRAAYGDRNDYEKLSVLPAPLMLDDCPDLAIVAAAQRRWDDVLALVRQQGLRPIQLTSQFSSSALTVLMESAAQGIEPVSSLTITRLDHELFRKDAHPSFIEALTRLGYDRASSRSVIRHVLGAQTLEKAPGINRITLRDRGFDEAALQKLEEYLPYVNNLRLAFTPWILGMEFCRKVLKIPAAKIDDPAFDLLWHLGFSEDDIRAANEFCYGHDGIEGAKDVRAAHASVFACSKDISAEARIRMAAAIQSFMSGDAGLVLMLSASSPAAQSEALLLSAWRQGVKSVKMNYEMVEAPATKRAAVPKRKSRPKSFLHTQPMPLVTRKTRLKAGGGVVSLGRGKVKSSSLKDKRG